jgi:hypothetical protein
MFDCNDRMGYDETITQIKLFSLGLRIVTWLLHYYPPLSLKIWGIRENVRYVPVLAPTTKRTWQGRKFRRRRSGWLLYEQILCRNVPRTLRQLTGWRTEPAVAMIHLAVATCYNRGSHCWLLLLVAPGSQARAHRGVQATGDPVSLRWAVRTWRSS